jgi:hypothetical protein
MLPNSNKELSDLINNSTYPILIFVMEHCENNSLHDRLKEEVQKHSRPVGLFSMCYQEHNMPFPRLLTNSLYYFFPKNLNVAFWRGPTNCLDDVQHDIDTVYKMWEENVEYYEAKFGKKIQEQVLKSEEYLLEDVSEYPSMFQQARNLAKDIWKTGKSAAKGLPVLVSAKEGYRRLELCRFCDKFDSKNERCKECGCFMKTKTQLAAASCPLGKWEAVV